jgi:O-antigen chain-terminating methyltransferase
MKWYVRPLAEKTTERNRIEAEVVHGLLRQVERLEREIQAYTSGPASEGEAKPESARDRYPDWYFGLENRLRGSSEEIAKECSNYLGLFEGKKRVLDLGCGRGEFLEILHRKGIPAEGIDVDPDMVAVCREKGLRVEQGDLFDRLRREPNGSLDGIFCSQVVEHQKPEEILDLVRLAFHRLSERGVLVIETLNPACLTILSGAFYADPTHRAPVHPLVLRYFLERTGFAEVDTWYSAEVPLDKRLELLKQDSESDSALNRNFEKLNSVLYGYAHYAAIGRKR